MSLRSTLEKFIPAYRATYKAKPVSPESTRSKNYTLNQMKYNNTAKSFGKGWGGEPKNSFKKALAKKM